MTGPVILSAEARRRLEFAHGCDDVTVVYFIIKTILDDADADDARAKGKGTA